MPEIKLGNSGINIGNALAGLLKGKSDEDDKRKVEALRERAAKLEEDKLSAQLGENAIRKDQTDRQLHVLEANSGRDAEQWQHAQDKEKRELEERHIRESGLRDRLQQLHGKTPVQGLNDIGETELERQIESKLTEQARMREIDETGKQRVLEIKQQHQYDLSKQLEQVHRLQEIANTNMLTVRRYLNDTITRIQTDPTLMRQYADLMKTGGKDALKQMVQNVTHRDLYAEYDAAAMQTVQAGQQAFVLGGAGAGTLSPLAKKAVDDALPFKFKDPQAQAAVAAEYTAKIKAGQPVDMRKAAVDGVPVDDIARSAGMQLDPMTGMSTKAAVQAPAAGGPLQINQPGVMPAAGGRGIEALFGGMFKPSTAVSPQNSNVATDPMSGAVVHDPNAVYPAGASGSWTGGQPPVSAPPAASAAPSPVVAPPAQTPIAAPPVQTPLAGAQFSPALNAAQQSTPLIAPSGDTTLGGEQPGRLQQMLKNARSMPEAEQFARGLLDMGMDYGNVISSAPPAFQSMLSAKLPKRIPVKALPAAVQQPNNPFSPAGSVPATSRPLFSPPSV